MLNSFYFGSLHAAGNFIGLLDTFSISPGVGCRALYRNASSGYRKYTGRRRRGGELLPKVTER
jgi:hypothetical protein